MVMGIFGPGHRLGRTGAAGVIEGITQLMKEVV